MLNKNDVAQATIESYTADGAGVARLDGMAVFVPHAVRGDVCALRIVKVLSTHAYARIERLLVPGAARIAPECPVSARCGGCTFQHMTYEEELSLKRRRVHDALTRIGRFELDEPEITPSCRQTGYRNKAQFPLCRREDRVAFGLFRGHSHDVVPVERCLIQSEEANALARAVCDWADQTGASVYNELDRTGLLRHVYVREGSGGVQLVLVATSGKIRGFDALLAGAKAACPRLSGIVVNVNRAERGRILGEHCVTLWGEGLLRDELCGLTFDLSPLSFYQIHHAQTERLYAEVARLAALDGAQTALDLYCGVGTITLALARTAGRVIGVEIVPAAIRDARANAAQNGISHAEFMCADASEAAKSLIAKGLRPDVVVCDPPRRGMDAAACDAVVALSPARMVYVSCDPASLARDARRLADAGYALAQVRAFDMFPRTAHVETVALLTKSGQ